VKHVDSKVVHEQFSQRNCLLIHGIPYVKGEYIYKAVLNFLKKVLYIEWDDDSIDRSHRLQSMTTTNNRLKPMTVKLVTHKR